MFLQGYKHCTFHVWSVFRCMHWTSRVLTYQGCYPGRDGMPNQCYPFFFGLWYREHVSCVLFVTACWLFLCGTDVCYWCIFYARKCLCVFFFKCFGVCSWFFVPWRTNRTSIVVKAVVDPVAVDCHSVCISCKRKVFLWFSLPWMCWMAFSTLGALWEEEEEA